MDNQNDPNNLNSSNPVAPFGTSTQSPPNLGLPTPPVPNPLPTEPNVSSLPSFTNGASDLQFSSNAVPNLSSPTQPIASSNPWPTPPLSDPTSLPSNSTYPAVNSPWPTSPLGQSAQPVTAADPTSGWTPPQTSPAPTPPATAALGGTWPSVSETTPSQQPASTWTPPVQASLQPEPALPTAPEPTQANPTPTFMPTSGQPIAETNPTNSLNNAASPTEATTPNMSPLDNPWGAPTQPPPLNHPPEETTQPSWMGVSTNSTSNQNTPAPPGPVESAPTDLSHLINNNSQPSATPPVPETLVVPSTATPEVPNLPTQNHKSIPKWMLGAGAGLLILVITASAYFILGVGQPAKDTTSLPATINSQTAEVKPPLPIPTPAVPSVTAPPTAGLTEAPPATGSANFGQLGGSTGSTQQATSAADLLRQRQQTGR